MKSSVTEILGCEYPVIQGGMAWVAEHHLAAAVSEAGGFGIIGAASAPADIVREEIRKCKALTDKPFGVNIMLLNPNADEVADKILERLKTEKSENTVFAEILSNCKIKREGIKEILLHGLKLGDRVPEFCSYIVKYGDETMLDELIKFGEEAEGYVDFKEINIAVEALGGTSLTEREFAEDADYIVMNVKLDKGNGGKNKRK